MQEDMLLKLLNKKPEKALKPIMEKYSGLVYHLAYGKLKNICTREDIEELAGDVFFSLYQNHSKISADKGGIKAFLCTVTLRKAVDIYRKSKSSPAPVELKDEIMLFEYSLDELYLKKESFEKLNSALNSLSETDREIIVKKAFLGLSAKEIGEEMNLSYDAVRKRISRAYSALREKLEGVI